MKKIIRITESQFFNLIEQKKILFEQTSPTYINHWEQKFMKSVEILLELGHKPDELIKKIQIIESKNNKQI